jgi:aryl-alcohol dehydrogenase-like predicted oxidoreductase
MIDAWGGWGLFQELLVALKPIADKHQVSIANIGARYVLDRPAVAGVIIGARLSVAQHITDNARVFGFTLEADDLSAIEAILSKSRDLMQLIGDCGDEYR